MKKIILPALLAFGCLTAAQFAAANPQEHYCYAMYGNGAWWIIPAAATTAGRHPTG